MERNVVSASSKPNKKIEHRACPNCEAHVATNTDERPALGRCFGCYRPYTIWEDESIHALCACGKPHDERGHPYTVGEARLYLESGYGKRMEEYGRHLFEFLLEKAEAEDKKTRSGR